MKRLLRNPDIVWRIEKRREEEALRALEEGKDVTERGTVILIISGMMHQLNLVGGRIWSLCDGTRTEAEVSALLAGEFEVDSGEVADDVAEFVADLCRRGWLIDA